MTCRPIVNTVHIKLYQAPFRKLEVTDMSSSNDQSLEESDDEVSENYFSNDLDQSSLLDISPANCSYACQYPQ